MSYANWAYRILWIALPAFFAYHFNVWQFVVATSLTVALVFFQSVRTGALFIPLIDGLHSAASDLVVASKASTREAERRFAELEREIVEYRQHQKAAKEK